MSLRVRFKTEDVKGISKNNPKFNFFQIMISIRGFPDVCTAVWLHLHDEYGEERMQGRRHL